MTARWYIVHAYSNFEKKVAEDIENKAKQKGLSHQIGNSPATECVSLIAQHTRLDRDRAPPATWPEAPFPCG